MNPMKEFKQSYSKEYDIQGKKFLFRSLSAKEINDIDFEVSKRCGFTNNDDFILNTKKIETLIVCLVSIDGIQLKSFDDVQAEISKGKNIKEVLREEVSSWDDSFSNLLYLYYLKMIKEKDSKFKKETEFLNSEVL